MPTLDACIPEGALSPEASGLRCLAVVAAHNAMFWRLFDSL